MSTWLESLHRELEYGVAMSADSTVLLVTHGLTARLFLMRWYRWSVDTFEATENPGNAAILVMERDALGRYALTPDSLAVVGVGRKPQLGRVRSTSDGLNDPEEEEELSSPEQSLQPGSSKELVRLTGPAGSPRPVGRRGACRWQFHAGPFWQAAVRGRLGPSSSRSPRAAMHAIFAAAAFAQLLLLNHGGLFDDDPLDPLEEFKRSLIRHVARPRPSISGDLFSSLDGEASSLFSLFGDPMLHSGVGRGFDFTETPNGLEVSSRLHGVDRRRSRTVSHGKLVVAGEQRGENFAGSFQRTFSLRRVRVCGRTSRRRRTTAAPRC